MAQAGIAGVLNTTSIATARGAMLTRAGCRILMIAAQHQGRLVAPGCITVCAARRNRAAGAIAASYRVADLAFDGISRMWGWLGGCTGETL
jgi:hypothetical protein